MKNRRDRTFSIVIALLSGPVLSALLLLIPLGMLTGLSVVLDPSLAMFEFVPEEELLLPFLLLAVLISAANVRLATVMARDRKYDRIFKLTTSLYFDDASGADNIHGHPGRDFARDFSHFFASHERATVTLSEPIGEDYGWGFWAERSGFSPLWVAFAHSGRKKDGERADDYMVAVTMEPPLLPWRRLTYKPDFHLRHKIEVRLKEFFASRNIAYVQQAEAWVDPEEKSHPEPRF